MTNDNHFSRVFSVSSSYWAILAIGLGGIYWLQDFRALFARMDIDLPVLTGIFLHVPLGYFLHLSATGILLFLARKHQLERTMFAWGLLWCAEAAYVFVYVFAMMQPLWKISSGISGQ